MYRRSTYVDDNKMSSSLITRFHTFYLLPFFFHSQHDAIAWLPFFSFASRIFFISLMLLLVYGFELVFTALRGYRAHVSAFHHQYTHTKIQPCLCLVNRKPDGYLNEDLWELFSATALKGRIALNMCVYFFFISLFLFSISLLWHTTFIYFQCSFSMFPLSFSIVRIIMFRVFYISIKFNGLANSTWLPIKVNHCSRSLTPSLSLFEHYNQRIFSTRKNTSQRDLAMKKEHIEAFHPFFFAYRSFFLLSESNYLIFSRRKQNIDRHRCCHHHHHFEITFKSPDARVCACATLETTGLTTVALFYWCMVDCLSMQKATFTFTRLWCQQRYSNWMMWKDAWAPCRLLRARVSAWAHTHSTKPRFTQIPNRIRHRNRWRKLTHKSNIKREREC